MLIEEAFKRFTNGVLSETKIKKEYDLCIDVYSKTQLIDLSALQNSPDILQYMKAINADGVNKISTHSAILYINNTSPINLPFESCFFKLVDNVGKDEEPIKEVYITLREYAPMINTGALIMDFGYQILQMPFHIKYENLTGKMEVVFKISFLYTMANQSADWYLSHLSDPIKRLISALQVLNSKSHTIYKVSGDKVEYLRKKLVHQTIKVQRPIYIYLAKETEIKRIYPKYSNRTIERLSSWLVRGHWRRLDNPKKRGKDAQGKYVVEGFTWVVPHVCGDRDEISNRTYIAVGK